MSIDPASQYIWLLATGIFAAYCAKKRGKNPFLWFMAGFLFGIVGLCFLLFFPSLQKYFQKKTGNKTKDTVPPAPVEAPSLPTPQPPIWYYLDQDNIQKGPISFQFLQRKQQEGEVQTHTYVWNETLTMWKKWEELFPTTEK